MTSIGDTLRRERLKKGIAVPQIAGELKIAARFIEAIEADDFAKLPGGVFTKSFVRQYATSLGLDGGELVAEMQRTLEPPSETEAISDKYKPDVPVIPMSGGENWRSLSDRRIALPPWFQAGALLVLLMIICSGMYWWWERSRHEVSAVEVPTAHSTPAPPPVVPVAKPPESSEPAPATAAPAVSQSAAVETAAQQPATTASPAPAPVVKTEQPSPTGAVAVPTSPPLNPNASVRLSVTADEPVWIRADVNGKVDFQGTLQAHETRNVSADGEVKLRLGNAGGVTIMLNGKPVGVVGPKGQVRTVQFTSGGFQIVSPPKSLDPLDRL